MQDETLLSSHVFEFIWWERPFWMDDNGEYTGQIGDCIGDCLMTGSLGRQPTTILENMNNRGTWSQRRQTVHRKHRSSLCILRLLI